MSRIGGYALAVCLIGAAPAPAGAFLDDVLSTDAQVDSYLGNWIDNQTDDSAIARLVVTAAGPSHVRIHLFGRCEPAECDWGTAIGRNHSAAPGSGDVRSIAAEFDTPGAHKRLTLRLGPGKSLRFEVVTDFDKPGDGHDFETSGLLTAAPEPVAQTPPPVAAAPPQAATSVASTAVLPDAVTAPPPAGVAAAVPEAPATQEDCAPINLADLYVAPSDRGWQLRDYDHVILNFRSDHQAALKAQEILSYYRFDEQCFVARPLATMLYWRSAGEVPHTPMPHEDCSDVHPAAVKAAADGGDWKVLDGSSVLLDYGEDRAHAELAASTIRTYRLNRECFVARPSSVMQYWLAAP
jgi:hypothetical protein